MALRATSRLQGDSRALAPPGDMPSETPSETLGETPSETLGETPGETPDGPPELPGCACPADWAPRERRC